MPRGSPPLLARLRRHHGLWVLAVAVLLIKLASSTVCMADGLGRQGSATLAAGAATLPVAAPAHVASSSDDDCLLGEGGSCHCACLHAVPLPATGFVSIAPPAATTALPPTRPGSAAGIPASPLRPPIA